MNSNTSPANAPCIRILMEYGGEAKRYPDLRKCLLFVAKMDNGAIETVYIEPGEAMEGAKSSDLRNRDRTRQARHMFSPEEWFALEYRYTRKR